MTLGRVVALAGGIGGARLVDGLAEALPAEQLTVVVNTGDDFEHLGLWVSPDVDTVVYTLAGLSDRQRGWGLSGETFRALEAVGRLGGPTWFQLGDADLAMHLLRTQRLRAGDTLTEVTRAFASALGVNVRVLPMCDAPRPTKLLTRDDEWLDFQEYLVRRRATPRLARIESHGTTTPTREVLDSLERADLVVIAPSNPYVSIDPILSLEGVRERVRARPTIAVSPLVRGRAVKGPLAEMLRDVGGVEPSSRAILDHYGDFLDALVVETGEEASVGHRARGARIVMGDRADRARLAREVLAFGAKLAP